MKYQIIEASTTTELEKLVRREIDEGWEPQGGIHGFCFGDGDFHFYQAMIKSRIRENCWQPTPINKAFQPKSAPGNHVCEPEDDDDEY